MLGNFSLNGGHGMLTVFEFSVNILLWRGLDFYFYFYFIYFLYQADRIVRSSSVHSGPFQGDFIPKA